MCFEARRTRPALVRLNPLHTGAHYIHRRLLVGLGGCCALVLSPPRSGMGRSARTRAARQHDMQSTQLSGLLVCLYAGRVLEGDVLLRVQGGREAQARSRQAKSLQNRSTPSQVTQAKSLQAKSVTWLGLTWLGLTWLGEKPKPSHGCP